MRIKSYYIEAICFFTLIKRACAQQTIEKYDLGYQLQYTTAELKYAAHHAFVDHEHKLVYCGIPKVACTEFYRLFFRFKEKKKNGLRWLSDPHFRLDRPLLSDIGTENATRIMNDPEYTKFVYFRDPVDRLRSAWMDKFVNWQRYTYSYKVKLYDNKNLSFAQFVEILLEEPSRDGKRGLGPKTNPHWRPQRFLCNLEKFLPLYNYIGSFDHLYQHNKQMLQALHLWDDFGKSGWARSQLNRVRVLQRRQNLNKIDANRVDEGPPPHSAMFERNIARHRMSLKDQSMVHNELLTPDLVEKIKQAYWMDYELLDAIGFYQEGALPTDGRKWASRYKSTRSATTGRGLLCTYNRAFECPNFE